jgi:hypothetical protein
VSGAEPAPFAGRVKIVITGGVFRLQDCTLYAHHVPVLQSHHVIPESCWRAAGKPPASPMRELCPNCHMATHAAIDGLLRGLDVSLLPPRAVALAHDAITGADDNDLEPAPTL